MKLIKTKLGNRLEDEFLADNMIVGLMLRLLLGIREGH